MNSIAALLLLSIFSRVSSAENNEEIAVQPTALPFHQYEYEQESRVIPTCTCVDCAGSSIDSAASAIYAGLPSSQSSLLSASISSAIKSACDAGGATGGTCSGTSTSSGICTSIPSVARYSDSQNNMQPASNLPAIEATSAPLPSDGVQPTAAAYASYIH